MRVLVVHDGEGWCKHRAALGIQKYVCPPFEVEVAGPGGYADLTPHRREAFDAIYHLYFFHSRPAPGVKVLVGTLAAHGWMYPFDLNPTDWRKKGTTKTRNLANARPLLPHMNGIICRNAELRHFAMDNGAHSSIRIPAGIDVEVFTPGPKLRERKRPVIGWCGNITGATNFKGYNDILAPLQAITDEEFEFKVNTKNLSSGPLTREAMVEWYRDCDIFISTSSNEGTPNPPFEAAACGIPVISTDVGAVTDWAALRMQGMVVSTYHDAHSADNTVREIAEHLDILKGPSKRRFVGDILRQSIVESYSFEVIAPKILNYISSVAEVSR
jgi:glycosyltransferase involved in cell wall biosynthesis